MTKSPWHRRDPTYAGRQPTYKPPPSTSWWAQEATETPEQWRQRVARESVNRFVGQSGPVYVKDGD